MKFLHTSDWHLGRTLHGADLTSAFEKWCAHVVEVARTELVDALLISGDVYDRGVPPLPMVDLLSETLAELSEFTQVIATSGNHDSPRRLGFASGLLRPTLSIVTDSLTGCSPIPVVSGGELAGVVYALPYLDPDFERARLVEGEVLARSHEAVVGAALGRIAGSLSTGAGSVDGARVPVVVMAHEFVVGGEPSDSERDLRIGGVDSVPAGLFRIGEVDGAGAGKGSRAGKRAGAGQEGTKGAGTGDSGLIDYVALGHLHRPQRVGGPDGPVMRYSGSPIAFSFSEENHKKSSVLVTIEDGTVSTELIDAPVDRPLATVTGTLEELLSRKYDGLREHFLRVRVTDPERPRDLSARIKKVFPYALDIQDLSERTRINAAQIAAVREDPLGTLGDFFAEAGGRDVTADEKATLEAALLAAEGQVL